MSIGCSSFDIGYAKHCNKLKDGNRSFVGLLQCRIDLGKF